jgi:hypothetical protein
MAVVGGTAEAVGMGGGTCGVANVACDGLKRNHVSLTFPDSCGDVGEIAAQETSHNWGLEHVDNQSDLMFPFTNGSSKAFRDQCFTIDHSTGGAVTQCTYVHEVYCPDGEGEQQNSHAELLGVFGAREADDIAPEIVEISPEDGGTYSSADSIKVAAKITENSNFVGAKWTWIDGLPEDLDEYTACTNNVCTQDYNFGVGFDPNEAAWDFVNLQDAPAGTYKMKFEVLDGYGNGDSKTITFTVVDGPVADSSGGSDSASGDDEGTGDDGDDGSGGDDGNDDGTGATTSPMSDDGGDKQGCACGVAGGRGMTGLGWGSALLALGLVGRGRR